MHLTSHHCKPTYSLKVNMCDFWNCEIYLGDSNQSQYGVQLFLGQLARCGAVGQGPDLSESFPWQTRWYQNWVEFGCVNTCWCHGELKDLLEQLCEEQPFSIRYRDMQNYEMMQKPMTSRAYTWDERVIVQPGWHNGLHVLLGVDTHTCLWWTWKQWDVVCGLLC